MHYKAVYSYDPNTGKYQGTARAWESPLEPGVYLIPAHATEVEPPEVDENHQAIWNGESWDIKEIPVEPEPEKHEPTKEELLEMIRQIRNEKLYECDWTQLPDAPLTNEQKQAWQEYRQALRDLPQTIDMEAISSLDDVVWPKCPLK